MVVRMVRKMIDLAFEDLYLLASLAEAEAE